MKLAGKVCVVAGGGSGIGRATCLLFAREGAQVVVADTADATEVAQACGNDAFALKADVADSAAVGELVAEVVARCGRIDVLVNNAGYGIEGDVVTTSEADWVHLMSVNVNGVFHGCKHAIPVMRGAGGGVIVNTASVVAQVGITNRAAYCASKGAVAALTRAMALDHAADNIRINAVAPGTIDSPYFAQMFARKPALRRELEARQVMDRLGRPEEIAAGILFLASDEASFMTGTILTIDGGWTAR